MGRHSEFYVARIDYDKKVIKWNKIFKDYWSRRK